MNKRYDQPLFIKVILVFIILTITFEIGLRIFITSPSNHLYDPVIGFKYKPHSELFLGSEGFAKNTTNALGLNDEEFVLDENKKRALILGDSYTEARQVARYDNFSSITERTLPHWDLINAGRDGVHILHTYTIAKRLQTIIQPNLIVLVMNNGDYIGDMSDKHIKIIIKNNVISDMTLQANPQEQLKQKFQWFVEKSALAVQLIRKFKPVFIEVHKNLTAMLNPPQAKTHTKYSSISSPTIEKTKLFSVFLKKLQTFAPVIIVYINQLEYETTKHVYPAKKPYNNSLIVKKIAAENNIPFINTASYLTEQYFLTKQPPFGFHNKHLPHGHLNENGHIGVSRALSTLIKQYDKALKK